MADVLRLHRVVQYRSHDDVPQDDGAVLERQSEREGVTQAGREDRECDEDGDDAESLAGRLHDVRHGWSFDGP
jgi:hypothetical protein